MNSDTSTPLGEALLLERHDMPGRRPMWVVIDQSDWMATIGMIEWSETKEQYVYNQRERGCLTSQKHRDLAGFLDQLNGERDGS